MIYGHGKIRRYMKRTHAGNAIPEMSADTMAAFMMSTRGNYNGKSGAAALAALDHARDYSLTDSKFKFWMDVYECITMWGFNMPKGKGN